MSKGLIKANASQVQTMSLDWLKRRKLKISEGSVSESQGSEGKESCIKGVGAYCQAIIWFRPENQGCAAEIRVSPRAYWNAILHVTLFILLGWSLVLIHRLLDEWTISGVSLLILCAVLIISLFYWQNNRLSGKLARIERSFWELAESRHDIQQYTRAEGRLYRRKNRLLAELMFVCYLVVVGGMFLGFWGVVLILVLCVPILVMNVTDMSWGNDPLWHWRLWIMSTMGRWTFLMLFVFGMAPILIALETFMELKMYKDPESWSVKRAIAEGRFREIHPATAKQLEADVHDRLWDMSAPESTDAGQGQQRFRFLVNGISGFLVMVVSVVFFVLLPFRGMQKSHGRWAAEVGEKAARDGPNVPYLPKAWKRNIPRLLRCVIVFHALFGGLIHWAATAFCFEGISYAFWGRTVLWDQAANLWSWFFALPKILFGDSWGWYVGLLLVVVISSPVVLMLCAFVRRIFLKILLMIRFRLFRWTDSTNHSQCSERIESFNTSACSRESIRRPELWLTSSDDVVIQLRGMLLPGSAVLEISRGAVELLDEAELQSVVAHELGHVRQGIRKVGLLKLLSSLALFPNHYLTLCLGWSASEIKADRFALAATGNPGALCRAIVKISTAQMDCIRSSASLRSTVMNKKKGIIRGILRRIHKVLLIQYASMSFFFGDRLFGYAHPYVSERLEAIASFHREAANESE